MSHEMFLPAKSRAELKCRTAGAPRPSVQWFAKGVGREAARAGDDQYVLAIEAVDKRDEGNYTCYVENEYGSDSVTYALHVQGESHAHHAHMGMGGRGVFYFATTVCSKIFAALSINLDLCCKSPKPKKRSFLYIVHT